MLRAALVLHLCVGLIFLKDLHAQAISPVSKPNPWIAGTLGAIVPGAGYLYNGDSNKAALGFTTTLGIFLPSFVNPTTKIGNSLNNISFQLARNAYGFSVYDTFQDALDLNGRPQLLVNNPHFTAGQLLKAPFQLENFTPRKVWFPLALVGGLAGISLIAKQIRDPVPLSAEKLILGIPALALMAAVVGAGEESDFRGFYYPAFSELTQSRYMGAVLQAALFAYMHTKWYGSGFPMITGGLVNEALRKHPPTLYGDDPTKDNDLAKFIATFIGGLHNAWITSSEENGLLKAVAFHAGWDFMLFTVSLLANNEVPPIIFSYRF